MRGRLRAPRVGAAEGPSLVDWRACSVPVGTVDGPEALERAGAPWVSMARPIPAAAALRDAKQWSLDGPARRFDAEEWWYRARFPRGDAADEVMLCFDGLATLADVWLNGAPLLTSDNMFLAHEVPVGALLRDENDLVLRFRSLDAALGARRPRPRWRAPMIEHQQMRWMRATLLGRTPGWSPPAAVVGPWKDVRLERRRGLVVEDVQLHAALRDVGTPRAGGAQGDASLDVSCVVRALGDARAHGRGEEIPRRVEAVLERAGSAHSVALAPGAGGAFAGRIDVPQADLWFPHTHGEPALYHLRLVVHGPSREVFEVGTVGFRSIAATADMGLSVNGVPVFARGACWTPLDPVRLVSDRAAYAAALTQARDAGMNMIRVGGTMAYEADDFYDLADELGILIWQDFMFANMDYPDEDAAFVASVEAEARQVLRRLQARPSVAVLCGNSEGEQQAAMWGAPRERWSPRLFHEVLARLSADVLPGVPYWPSSAHGGAFPHEATVGTTSYYGVGAYLRPLEDARRSEVRFATECLAFANVPADDHLPGGPSAKVHHPAWKARTPRDLGAGWDFDDVRDHYVADLFRLDPMQLRYADHERYLALGRVVTGEVMASAMGEWRRKRSVCGGAFVWFLRDLWTSAGWGVVDAGGRPKAAYYYLRRALQPLGIHLTDEGGSGIFVHVFNEGAAPLDGEIEVALFRAGETRVAAGKREVTVPGRDAIELSAARLFEGFLDLTYSYRFGPPSHDLAVATFERARRTARRERRSVRSILPLGLPATRSADVGLTATAVARPDGDYDLTLRTRAFAQSSGNLGRGLCAGRRFRACPPGEAHVVRLHRLGAGPLRGQAQALNSEMPAKITLLQ